MRLCVAGLMVVAFAVPVSRASAVPPQNSPPGAHASATCADYSNQAAAQRAADTRDADGDGIYCESLPCPCLGKGAGGGGGSPTPEPKQAPQISCGVERQTVKTLTDDGASRVNFTPMASTVSDLRALEAPDVGRHVPRQPGEFSSYRIKVRLRSFKVEDDSDIHLVVADPTDSSKTMIVELPNASCTRRAEPAARRKMAAARGALVRACGEPGRSKFQLLTGEATVTGVAFFDVIHGQRGVAPNGIELHPLLSFKPTSRCAGR
jgi:hypothetical protein